jgi:hypothetical protein
MYRPCKESIPYLGWPTYHIAELVYNRITPLVRLVIIQTLGDTTVRTEHYCFVVGRSRFHILLADRLFSLTGFLWLYSTPPLLANPVMVP